MRFHVVRTFVFVAAAVLAQAGDSRIAGAADADVGGSWMFRFAGNRGAAVLQFPGTPQFGRFEVHGAGYTTLFPAAAFTVDDGTTQTLGFNSRGVISGTLALDDPTRTSPAGTLVVTRGVWNATHDGIVLTGTLALGGAAARNVSLIGRRLVAPAVPPTGRTLDGSLTGRRVFSAKYDVRLYDELSGGGGTQPIVREGYPFLILEAGGPAHIDGAEVADSHIGGLLVSDARGMVCGRVTTSHFGPGVLRGQVKIDARLGLPVLTATIVCDGGRRVHLAAELESF